MSEPAARPIASASQTVGPFFHVGLGASDRCGVVAGPGRRRRADPPADPRARRRRRAGAGRDGRAPPGRRGGRLCAPPARPRIRAASAVCRPVEDGVCCFETIRPGAPARRRRPAPHVTVCLFMRGLLRHLYTRVYFEDDPALDAIRSCRSCRPTAGRRCWPGPRASDGVTWDFVVRLQGDDETVFFDL